LTERLTERAQRNRQNGQNSQIFLHTFPKTLVRLIISE
jgi:hypothetical protein